MTWDSGAIDQRALDGLKRIYEQGREIQGRAEYGISRDNSNGKLPENDPVLPPLLASKVFGLVRVFPFVGGWRA